jgi:sigma-54-interacting transcriptional regulator
MAEMLSPIAVKRSTSRRAAPLTVAATAVALQGLAPGLVSSPEWHGVCTMRHNALFQGPAHVTDRLLALLQPYLRRPTIWRSALEPLELPSGECGALVLQNVSAFDAHDQAVLLRWLDSHRTQVVSTTQQALFPMIARGLFDDSLYYHLNVTLLSIDSSGTLI